MKGMLYVVPIDSDEASLLGQKAVERRNLDR